MSKVKEFFKKNRGDALRALVYFGIYLFIILFWEVAIRIVISGKIGAHNAGVIAFAPAEAMFLTALTGFHKKQPIINKIICVLLTVLLTVFYGAQMVYFKVFGSVLSVSLLGMGGDAVGNFSWAIGSILKTVWLNILIFLLPLILISVFAFVKKMNKLTKEQIGSGYALWIHGVCLVLTIGLWFGGLGGLKAAGTDRQSAYYILHDYYADSDTTAEKLGVLSTSLIEVVSRYWGIRPKANEEVVAAINNDALILTKPEPVQPVVITDVTDVEEVVEPEIEPVEINPQVIDAFDFTELASKAPDYDTKVLCEYFASKEPTKTNEYTGMFEGYNLIYICAESFNRYAIDPDITPLMYEMANNGIVLTNYYNSFKNTTSNGEFAFATSLWPDVSRIADNGAIIGSFPQSANTYMPYGLGDMFNEIEVPTYGFHNFYGAYYKRNYTWPNLGYKNLKFLGQGMIFTSAWPASDLEMFEQSVDDFIEDDQFHAYYMTFSGHGPFTSANYMFNKNIDKVTELANGKYTDSDVLGYFCGEYELELGLEYLVARLEEAGKLDKTVIVLTGDHFPYYLTQNAQTVFGGDSEYLADFDMYKSTCIIYNSAIEEPIINDEYCCNVDILPTIFNLFGFKYDSRLLMGNDVFSEGVHRARLYNGSFLTDYVWYNKRTGEQIWQPASEGFTEEQLSEYFDAMLDYTTSEYTVALKMQTANFYLYAWANSGLMTPEEITAEQNRERNGNAIYEAEIAARQEEEREEEMRLQGLNPDGTPIDPSEENVVPDPNTAPPDEGAGNTEP